MKNLSVRMKLGIMNLVVVIMIVVAGALALTGMMEIKNQAIKKLDS